MCNLDIIKSWFDFGNHDLIFKVTAVEKIKFHTWGHLFSLKTILLCPPIYGKGDILILVRILLASVLPLASA